MSARLIELNFILIVTTMTMRESVSAYMRILVLIHHSMTTLDHASHSIRRKGYASHYTPNNVAKFQPEMHEASIELINVILLDSLSLRSMILIL